MVTWDVEYRNSVRPQPRQAPSPVPITVAHGDGIGPEIMAATLRILEAAGAALDIERVDIGERTYGRGFEAGIDPEAWTSLRRTRVFLKAPISTPQGGGFKSLNVTVRKTLGLYANIRPCVSYHPFVKTKHPRMDVVIVRENEEDTYGGIEHRQTNEVIQCLKLISRPGCERIVRYAFEYARANNRRKVTCFTKDNIMKQTDGLFHRVFDEIAAEYTDIEHDHCIVDIGAARLADTPEIFDVIVMPNLYGDILSDVAAQIAGSVGLAGSSNIGDECAMFEAIHGSAPPLAGRDIANPSGLLMASVMMLVHIGQTEIAADVHNAWLKTIEDGIHTADIFTPGLSARLVGTRAFADAVIDRLGLAPVRLTPASYEATVTGALPALDRVRPRATKQMVGVDVFLDWDDDLRDPASLAGRLRPLAVYGLNLTMISNRGTKVWPDGIPETFCTDHWRCRFEAPAGRSIGHGQITSLLDRIAGAGLDFIKTESLCTFDGVPAYSRGQGQ